VYLRKDLAFERNQHDRGLAQTFDLVQSSDTGVQQGEFGGWVYARADRNTPASELAALCGHNCKRPLCGYI